MMYSRTWYHMSDCIINDTWDASVMQSGTQSDANLSVINVNSLYFDSILDMCTFYIASIGTAGYIKNAAFVLNVSLDLSN